MPRSAASIVKDYVRRDYQCSLGDKTAQAMVDSLIRRLEPDRELYAEARGRDLMSGLPKTIVLSAHELRDVVRRS